MPSPVGGLGGDVYRGSAVFDDVLRRQVDWSFLILRNAEANCGVYIQLMPAILYRCPVTAQHVTGWVADAPEDDSLETIECVACKRVHVVNRKTGKVCGADE